MLMCGEYCSCMNSPSTGSCTVSIQKTALMLVAVLHFLSEDDKPREIVNSLVDALPNGSWVVASHATDEYLPPEQLAKVAGTGTVPTFLRAGRDFEAMFIRPDLHLEPPGVQSVSRWWVDTPKFPDEEVAVNGLVGQVVR